MKVEISLQRGAVTVVNYDPEFHQKLMEFVEKEADENPMMGLKESAYYELRQGYDKLVKAIEKILPEETEQPFQIVLDVKGTVDRSPGPRNY